MRGQQERTMRDLYDRTRHKDLLPTEESAEGRGRGCSEGSEQRELASKMEDKTLVRKRSVSSSNTRVKAESGTCNVCSAPCSSCLHPRIRVEDSNVECASSQTCSTRSEVKNNSRVRSEKGLCSKGENDDEFSATSGHVSYSVTGGNKVVARSSIADDSSEVDMPSKRRRLLNQDTRLSRAEYLDDSNSCVTGVSAEGKLHVDKKKLSTSASSRDLTAKDYKANSMANHSKLRNQYVDESKKGSDSHDMHPSSSGRFSPVDSSVMTKKLLRTQSSVSALNRLSPNRQAHEFGKPLDNLSHQSCEKASLLKNNEQPRGGQLNPCIAGDNNHDMLAGYSNTHANKDGFSLKDLDNGALCSKDEIQEHADIHSNDDVKNNVGGKQDSDQDCSMDISSDRKLNIQHDVMTDCGNSEGLIDVNVCDICGDVGREYQLVTCTRCLEGAEHTYCMRVKLEKVPVGEWFCEECQLKEDQNNTRSNYGIKAINVAEGKNQRTESQSKPKSLQIVVPDLDAPPQVTHSPPTADRCDGKSKRLQLASADTQTRQVKDTTPAAERLDVKNKKSLSIADRNKLQVLTSDLDTRPHSVGTPKSGVYNKKNQSSELLLNRKKLRVSTDVESPLSSEGLRSPPISCKRLAESTSSPKPRLFKTGSLGKQDVISRENSFKKSNKGGLTSVDNVPVRTTQVVKSSKTLSRSYSLGNMVNAKAPVPSPRGHLSKQLSFNSTNNGPKVKQLADGMSSKLRPAELSPRHPRDKEPIKKIVQSGSFKREASGFIDAGSSKQNKTFHLSQDEKAGLMKPIKERNLIERRASFSLKKPNIPSSPRPDSCMKSGERKIDQDISRSGTSILKSSKRPGYAEKKQSYDLSRSENGKEDVTVHEKPMEVSGKDAYGVNTSDPPVESQCAKKDRSNDVEDDDSLISVNNVNILQNEHAEVVPTTFTATTCESDLQDIPREIISDDSAPKVVCCQQKLLENKEDDSCKIVEVVQDLGEILSVTPRCLQMAQNLYPPDNKLDKPDLKKEAFSDQSSALGNTLKDFVIPEQSYIWQGSFEVSRHGNSPEIFDGFQAYLSTCASSKVREVGEQLPEKIQLAEVPRHSSWPLQFNEVNPTEDNIALFFFAKDVESYERAYGKLLDNMLHGDLSLKANIGGTELLIFPSDKLPERIQRWNGLLFFWGIFYARKASSPLELPTNNCPLEQINGPVIQHDMVSPKALQPLGIDLNECPNDDISDPILGSESEKSGASDHNILLESKHEDRNLNASEIHHEETAGTRQIILGHPSVTPYGTNRPTISAGEGHDMVQDYLSAAKGSTGTAGGNKMEKADQNEALFCFSQQPGAIRLISNEMKLKKHGLLPSHYHFSGSKICDDQTKSTPSSDMGSLDSDLTNKRQKTSYGKRSTCIFGDEMPPIKCLSKIHPLPAGQDNPFDVLQRCHRGPSDPVSLKKPVPDHIIHVLSSDDEDSPEPSTSLNKASLKADEGSSALLSLSLSMVATKHNRSGSDVVDDEPLSLSLGLPSVVGGNADREMKQFLPEKPGINT